MTKNEKRLNAFHSNWAKKSIQLRCSIYFKVYFLTIFAHIFVQSAPAHLCKKFNNLKITLQLPLKFKETPETLQRFLYVCICHKVEDIYTLVMF
jgi:hypothetical protein